MAEQNGPFIQLATNERTMENTDMYRTNGEVDGANTDDASLQPLMPCLDNDGLAVGAFQSSSTPPGIPEVSPFTASSID